jgi:hypothetical protein
MKTGIVIILAMLTGCAYYPYPQYAQPAVIIPAPVVIAPQCAQYPTEGERLSCNRGAQQRYFEEQRYKENQAYRQGLGR